jgi:hypothetical protein
MLLFLLVLTGLLLLSYFLLLPGWTRVQIAGTVLGPSEAVAYAEELQHDLADREAVRLNLALPMHDETYERLRGDRSALPQLRNLRDALLQAARQGSPEDAPQAVRIDAMSFDAGERLLTVEGDVSGVGPRSMTVLAYFTDRLGELPFASQVVPPAFERREDDGVVHSPFVIDIVLKEDLPAIAQ